MKSRSEDEAVSLGGKKDGLVGVARSVVWSGKHSVPLVPDERPGPDIPTGCGEELGDRREEFDCMENVGVGGLGADSKAFFRKRMVAFSGVITIVSVGVGCPGLASEIIRSNSVWRICDNAREFPRR